MVKSCTPVGIISWSLWTLQAGEAKPGLLDLQDPGSSTIALIFKSRSTTLPTRLDFVPQLLCSVSTLQQNRVPPERQSPQPGPTYAFPGALLPV